MSVRNLSFRWWNSGGETIVKPMWWRFTEMKTQMRLKELKSDCHLPGGGSQDLVTTEKHYSAIGQRDMGRKDCYCGVGNRASHCERQGAEQEETENKQPNLPSFSHTPVPCQWLPLAIAVHRTQLPGVTKRSEESVYVRKVMRTGNKQHSLLSQSFSFLICKIG